MLHLHDRASMARALTLDLEASLARLLADRIGGLGEDLIDSTEYLVVEPGDTEADVARHVGFLPTVEPVDGVRFGEPGFEPYWDWLAERGGWFELIVTFGSAFAYVLLVRDADGAPAELRRMCRAYARD